MKPRSLNLVTATATAFTTVIVSLVLASPPTAFADPGYVHFKSPSATSAARLTISAAAENLTEFSVKPIHRQ